jgi:uncharacterized protein
MALNLKKLREMQGRTIAIDELYESLGVGQDQPFFIQGGVHVQGQAVHRDRIVFIDVRIQAKAVQTCSRCLAEVVSQLDFEEQLEFQPEEPESSAALLEREAFTYSLQESELSLQPYVVGLIASVLDPKPLCGPDCKGLCPTCGQDLNVKECVCAARREGDPRLRALKELLK